MEDLRIKEILDNKIRIIEKYVNLNCFPVEFSWNDDEYKDYPFRSEIFKWLNRNVVYDRTAYGIIVRGKK